MDSRIGGDMKALKITTDNLISIVDIKDDWRDIVREIGAELFECVYDLNGLTPDLIMLVDESGLIKFKNVNAAASELYRGNLIVGDVLIVQGDRENFTDIDDIELVMGDLMRSYKYLVNK